MTYLGIYVEAGLPLYKRVSNPVETVKSKSSSDDESSVDSSDEQLANESKMPNLIFSNKRSKPMLKQKETSESDKEGSDSESSFDSVDKRIDEINNDQVFKPTLSLKPGKALKKRCQ